MSIEVFDKSILLLVPEGSYAEKWAYENNYNYETYTNPVTFKGGIYELNEKKTAAVFTGPEKKSAKTLVIQDTVKINGKKYKVTEMAAGACKGMSKLTTLTIGKNVKTIGKEAFCKCKKAKTIKILGSALKTVGKNAFGGGYGKATVYCAKKKIKAYTKLLQNAGLSKKAVFKELK